MANKEIPIADDELDSLMAELEAETSGAVAAPVVKAAVAAPATTEADELADLEAELAVVEQDAPAAAAQPQPATVVAPASTPEDDLEAEMKALEAELNETKQVVAAEEAHTPDPVPEPAPAPVPVPEPEPASAPAPAPKVVKAVPTPAADPNLDNTIPAPARKAPELNFHIDMDKFREDVSVSETNLDRCMMEQAGLQAWHGAEAARAVAQAERVKLQVKIKEAGLFDTHRKRLALTGEKVTEKMVENAVMLDPVYGAIHNRLIEAETISDVRRACADSIKARRDMIIQLGADRRDEYKGQARINAAEESRTDLKARALKVAST